MRKFLCPFCSFRKNFYGNEARKKQKRVIGLTCPRCGKKVSEKDIARIKGEGPKPPGERRKRRKKVEASTLRKIKREELPEVDMTPIEWRTRDLDYTSPWEVSHPASRAGGRRYKPPPPTDITLEEAILVLKGIKTSAPIPKERRR